LKFEKSSLFKYEKNVLYLSNKSINYFYFFWFFYIFFYIFYIIINTNLIYNKYLLLIFYIMWKNTKITLLDRVVAKYLNTIEQTMSSAKSYNEIQILNDSWLSWGDDIININKINKLTYPNLFNEILKELKNN